MLLNHMSQPTSDQLAVDMLALATAVKPYSGHIHLADRATSRTGEARDSRCVALHQRRPHDGGEPPRHRPHHFYRKLKDYGVEAVDLQ